MSEDEEDIELTPAENDRFWDWLNWSYGYDGNAQRDSPIEQINKMLKSLPQEQLPGRNDPCPCGSGKKYKRCCGR